MKKLLLFLLFLLYCTIPVFGLENIAQYNNTSGFNLLSIGTAGQYLKVNTGADGYAWDNFTNITFTGLTYLNGAQSEDVWTGRFVQFPGGYTNLRQDSAQTLHLEVYNNNSPFTVMSILQNGNINITSPQFNISGNLTVSGNASADNLNVKRILSTGNNTTSGDAVIANSYYFSRIGSDTINTFDLNHTGASVRGLDIVPSFKLSGDFSSYYAIGEYIKVYVKNDTSARTLGALAGLRIDDGVKSAGVTIDTAYGIRVAAPTIGTTNIGIWNQGTLKQLGNATFDDLIINANGILCDNGVNVSSTGEIRLANNGGVAWRNNDNDADCSFGFGTLNQAEIWAVTNLNDNLTDGLTGGLRFDNWYNSSVAGYTVARANYLNILDPVPGGTNPPTITDAPIFWFNKNAGTHKAIDSSTMMGDGWLKINVNGTLGYIPYSTSKTTWNNNFITLGNVSAAYYTGNGSLLTGLPSTVISIQNNSVLTGNNTLLNFIPGSGIDLAVTNASYGVNITIGSSAGGGNVSQAGAVANTYFPIWTGTGTQGNSTYTTADAVNWNTAFNNYLNKSLANTTNDQNLNKTSNVNHTSLTADYLNATAINVGADAVIHAGSTWTGGALGGTGLAPSLNANQSVQYIIMRLDNANGGVNPKVNFKNGTGITWSIDNDTTNNMLNVTPTVTITQYTDALAQATILGLTNLTDAMIANMNASDFETADANIIKLAEIDTSAEIAAIVGDETGTGVMVWNTSPSILTATLVGPTTASGFLAATDVNATNVNTTNLKVTTGVILPASVINSSNIKDYEVAAADITNWTITGDKIVNGTINTTSLAKLVNQRYGFILYGINATMNQTLGVFPIPQTITNVIVKVETGTNFTGMVYTCNATGDTCLPCNATAWLFENATNYNLTVLNNTGVGAWNQTRFGISAINGPVNATVTIVYNQT